MSILFIDMLVSRGSREGQSLVVAVSKWIGTLAPTIQFGLIGDLGFPRGSLLVLVTGGLCSVFDLIYIWLLWRRSDTIGLKPVVSNKTCSHTLTYYDAGDTPMYCQACGMALTQQMRYCNRCGTQLVASTEEAAVKTAREKRLDEYLDGLFWITVFGLAFVFGGMVVLKKLDLANWLIFGYMVLSSVAFLINFGFSIWGVARINREGRANSRFRPCRIHRNFLPLSRLRLFRRFPASLKTPRVPSIPFMRKENRSDRWTRQDLQNLQDMTQREDKDVYFSVTSASC